MVTSIVNGKDCVFTCYGKDGICYCAVEKAWRGFVGEAWKSGVNVRDFIQNNYTPYDGDESFLAGPTDATNKLWGALQKLQKAERAKGGVLDMETEVVSSLTAYGPGYIDETLKDLEQIVGLQTDKPLKRAFMPYGGIKMAEQACTTYGYQPSEELHKIFTDYTRTHNQAVFDAYTPEMKAARHTHIITGLPDTYGRGRIVGDYRRVALYGIDALIKFKQEDFANCGDGTMTDDVIRLREEIARQINALKGMKKMAEAYGYDISQPAKNAKEACQWLYFGYLAAIKTQNGAAMSVGRISTFLDIYIQRDLENGTLTESQAQELIDHMVMKFRMVKFARIPSYNQLFSGDPVWATLEVGGIGMDGRSMVTKNCYRFLHTLENMGPAPEPNLTVLYSSALPESFKKYAAKVSIDTSSVQYENDDVMKPVWGDDYSICCCVSATQTGKEMQFFGARANLAKCLLYAINGGVDEKSHEQCGPNYAPITGEYLNYDEVLPKYVQMLDWLAGLYVNVLNLIQYMHDKYYYEEAEMALIDTDVRRTFATGIAGFSHVIDSLSAIKYAKVKVVRDETGLATGYEVEGDFPKYGNDDDRADDDGPAQHGGAERSDVPRNDPEVGIVFRLFGAVTPVALQVAIRPGVGEQRTVEPIGDERGQADQRQLVEGDGELLGGNERNGDDQQQGGQKPPGHARDTFREHASSYGLKVGTAPTEPARKHASGTDHRHEGVTAAEACRAIQPKQAADPARKVLTDREAHAAIFGRHANGVF